MRSSEELQETTNKNLARKLYKKVICNETGKCPICPWHRGENKKHTKHGMKTPRYKTK